MSEREQYEKKRRAQLDEWQAEMEELKAKAAKASADAQLELDRRIGMLERQIEQGRAMLDDLTEAGEDTWDEVRERVDRAWTEFEAGAKAAAKELQDD